MARASFWTGTVLLFLTAAGECISGADWIESNMHYAGCAAFMVLGIVNAPHCSRPKRGPALRALQVLGRYSFSIYLFHVVVQQVLLKLMIKVTGPAPGTVVIFATLLLIIAGSLAFGIMAGKFVEIPMLEWCKKRIATLKPLKTAPAAAAPAAPA
jgi:peptidoglycan/LPS O-acetylase OafA/YrhL